MPFRKNTLSLMISTNIYWFITSKDGAAVHTLGGDKGLPYSWFPAAPPGTWENVSNLPITKTIPSVRWQGLVLEKNALKSS